MLKDFKSMCNVHIGRVHSSTYTIMIAPKGIQTVYPSSVGHSRDFVKSGRKTWEDALQKYFQFSIVPVRLCERSDWHER